MEYPLTLTAFDPAGSGSAYRIAEEAATVSWLDPWTVFDGIRDEEGIMNNSKVSKAFKFSGIMLIISVILATFFGAMLLVPNNGILDRFTSAIGLACGLFSACVIFYDGIFKEIRNL